MGEGNPAENKLHVNENEGRGNTQQGVTSFIEETGSTWNSEAIIVNGQEFLLSLSPFEKKGVCGNYPSLNETCKSWDHADGRNSGPCLRCKTRF